MKILNKTIGNYGENLAREYIEKKGYIILEENFLCKLGEIDIIAKDNNYICFIEVKTRSSKRYGTPLESITNAKKRKLYKTAQYYICLKNIHKSYFRFDAIEVTLISSGEPPNITLIKNAF